MIEWIKNKISDWKFEKEFERKKRELIKLDPFIYDLSLRKPPSDKKN